MSRLAEVKRRQESFWRSLPTAAIAAHEAGHAVCAYVLNAVPTVATIAPDADSIGHVQWKGRNGYEDHIKVALAGGIAQVRLGLRASDDFGDWHDWLYIRKLIAQNANPFFDIEYLVDETKVIIDKHLSAVEAVAIQLTFRKTLYGSELWAVIEAAESNEANS